jgi:hypothetical protein
MKNLEQSYSSALQTVRDLKAKYGNLGCNKSRKCSKNGYSKSF